MTDAIAAGEVPEVAARCETTNTSRETEIPFAETRSRECEATALLKGSLVGGRW